MSTDLFWRTDTYLRDAVQYQLERELDVNPADVDVTAADGAISLTGFVHSFAEKLAAEQATGAGLIAYGMTEKREGVQH